MFTVLGKINKSHINLKKLSSNLGNLSFLFLKKQENIILLKFKIQVLF